MRWGGSKIDRRNINIVGFSLRYATQIRIKLKNVEIINLVYSSHSNLFKNVFAMPVEKDMKFFF